MAKKHPVPRHFSNDPKFQADMELRRKKVWDLMMSGTTAFREIAKVLGVSKSTVAKDVDECLAELHAENLSDAEKYRDTLLARLDELWKGTYPIARGNARLVVKDGKLVQEGHNADPEYVRAALKIIEQQAKLTGTYAPTKNELTGKGGAPLVPLDLSDLTEEQLLAAIAIHETIEAKHKED